MYGGVLDYRFSDSELWLGFDAKVTRTLGWPRELHIEQRVPASKVDEVRVALADLLRTTRDG